MSQGRRIVAVPTEDQNTEVDVSTSRTAACADDARTSPDALDVERLILSLDRDPRPPAPMPDERRSSDGGRFVAYRTSGRPAPPRVGEERRRQPGSELSVLVNVTPVPPELTQRDISTAPILSLPRRRSWDIWLGVAVVIAFGAFASWAVQSRPGVVTQQPATAKARVSESPVSAEVVVAPTPRIEPAPPPERREVVVPSSRPPTLQPRAATPPGATTTAMSAFTEPSSTEPVRPPKQAFSTW
jgi:hypothetical protein